MIPEFDCYEVKLKTALDFGSFIATIANVTFPTLHSGLSHSALY